MFGRGNNITGGHKFWHWVVGECRRRTLYRLSRWNYHGRSTFQRMSNMSSTGRQKSRKSRRYAFRREHPGRAISSQNVARLSTTMNFSKMADDFASLIPIMQGKNRRKPLTHWDKSSAIFEVLRTILLELSCEKALEIYLFALQTNAKWHWTKRLCPCLEMLGIMDDGTKSNVRIRTDQVILPPTCVSLQPFIAKLGELVVKWFENVLISLFLFVAK